MATETKLASRVVDAPTDSKPKAKSLCMFTQPMGAAIHLERTAKYAADPTAYLEQALGKETFEERKAMMSLPDNLDMDFYGKGTHKQHFEQHVATLMGKKHGLFFLTGVQAQLAAVKIHCDRAKQPIAAWHESSHLESAEESAYSTLYSLKRILLRSKSDELPTVEEIESVLKLPQADRPAVVLVELPSRTHGCKTYSFEDLERISKACKEAGVAFHMDGARLWEIEPYYQKTAGKTFADIAALFDTVYVSFYKGLGGTSGAMLFSNDGSVINEAKIWQRRAGGNAFRLAPLVVDCERGFNENIGSFQWKSDKMVEVVKAIKSATADFKTADGTPIVNFNPEEPTCCQIHTVWKGFTRAELDKARDWVQEKTNVKVFEWLSATKTADEKKKAEREADSKKSEGGTEPVVDEESRVYNMEWMIMGINGKFETSVWTEVYPMFCKRLLGIE